MSVDNTPERLAKAEERITKLETQFKELVDSVNEALEETRQGKQVAIKIDD